VFIEIFIGVYNGKYIMTTPLPYPDEDFLPYESQFSSQHREDGIIDLLCARIPDPNYQAIEIGSGNGEQNMIRNLIENRGYHGIGYDMHQPKWLHENYEHRICAVAPGKLDQLVESWPTRTPDFFSLDIDSFDFWVLKDLLYNYNFRPAVMCLEYLSYYGSDWVCAVRPDLHKYKVSFCGTSLGAYQQLAKQFGYEFFTVDTCGVNGFFYLPNRITESMDLLNLPRHTWREYPRYVGWRSTLNLSLIEFDQRLLFENIPYAKT
jgi:hypothetical protein